MPSRLSSLLVRDGLVGVKRMEKAFQRQVIYGGSLDTILLEMSLVPEERLVQYLALASGLPPAARDEGNAADPAATALIERDRAQQYRAVPVAIEGEAVRVLVCSPLEITALEDLADLIDRPLQPLIVPEYRWHLAFAVAYQVDAPTRFTTLARSLEVDPSSLPVGRARSVIIDEIARGSTQPLPSGRRPAAPAPARDHAAPEPAAAAVPPTRLTNPLGPVGEADATMRFEAAVDRAPEVEVVIEIEAIPDAARNRRSTMVGHVPNRAVTDAALVAGLTAPRIPSAALTPSSGVPVARDASSQRAQSQPIVTEGRDAPLSILNARELIGVAEDRDTVFLTLLRAARSKTRWAGLLTVQGGAAVGRVALAEPSIDAAAVTTVVIPLDVASPFRNAVQSMQPYVGALTSGNAAIDAMLSRFGGTVPPSALVLPIVLRERTVAIVVAHRVMADTRLVDVTELLPMATAASDALGRLIARTKAASSRALTGAGESGSVSAGQASGDMAGTGSAAVVIDHKAAGDTLRGQKPGDSAWRAPATSPARPVVASPAAASTPTAATIPSAASTPIESLLDTIEAAREGAADAAIGEAVERATETLGALNRRFPGTLRVDRFAVNGRALRASQYGGLLELVIALGTAATELLVEKMGSAARDARFYATVCCAELRPRPAVFALAERLFDQDFGVRGAAIEALAGYPLGDLGQALVRARRALHSTDPEVVGAAAMAVVALGDVEAVSDLISALARGDRPAEHARRALVAMTAQDFALSERKWRKWYESQRKRHRIEWLIDGLSHRDDAIRETAINDLRRLTGEFFGYHYDLPRRDRDAAAARWMSWWRDSGHRRFASPAEDERQRPTALLPARKDPGDA